MKIVKWHDKEFKQILRNVDKATFYDEVLSYRVRPRIDMAYL